MQRKSTRRKSNRSCWRIAKQVSLLFFCNDHFLHLINIAASSSTKKNHKKTKQELLKGRKPGQYPFISHNVHLLHSKHSQFLKGKGKPWCTTEETGRYVNIFLLFITLIVVLLACLQPKMMPCERLWQWRNTILGWPWYLAQIKEVQVTDSISKRLWALRMIQRRIPSFEWVLAMHTAIMLMIVALCLGPGS